MRQYLDMLNEVMLWGDRVPGRNGETIELFGLQNEYDLAEGFPLITTKKMAVKSIIGELLAFIRGYHHVQDFQSLGCNVWNANANSSYWLNSEFMKSMVENSPEIADGLLGRIYGVQWRNWTNPLGENTDQLVELIEGIKNDPYGRRHVVLAYNPGELKYMCLPPCHMFFQVNITPSGKLNLKVYQRSADMFLGVPYNIASYAFLMLILCHQTGYTPGKFIHSFGSTHIYSNHFDQVNEHLGRIPHKLPSVKISSELNSNCALEDYQPEHFIIEGYNHEPAIKAEMNV